jgi:hypothetical protein
MWMKKIKVMRCELGAFPIAIIDSLNLATPPNSINYTKAAAA